MPGDALRCLGQFTRWFRKWFPEQAVPPDSADRARVNDTLASLQAVCSSMDAERAPGGATLEQAGVVRSHPASFESSLRALAAPAQ